MCAGIWVVFVIHSETASLAEYVSGGKKTLLDVSGRSLVFFVLHKEKHSSNRLQPDSWMTFFLKRNWRKDKYRVWPCASDQGIRTLNMFERFPHLSPPQIAPEIFALFSCILDGKLTASVEFSSFSRRARTWRTLSAWLVAPLALTHTHRT